MTIQARKSSLPRSSQFTVFLLEVLLLRRSVTNCCFLLRSNGLFVAVVDLFYLVQQRPKLCCCTTRPSRCLRSGSSDLPSLKTLKWTKEKRDKSQFCANLRFSGRTRLIQLAFLQVFFFSTFSSCLGLDGPFLFTCGRSNDTPSVAPTRFNLII